LTKVPLISIVDDDDSVREAMQALIRSLGYMAATFASAEEFLQFDQLNDTACLIADVQMPGMNGIELQTRLISLGHRLPVIFITSFPEARARAQALSAGALEYLSKPFSDERLITCLDEALAARNG
jgi:FixJ family two-component response regulator